ncbi:MAG TPA: arsenic transporter [Peptococcaceae bacterium]|nr:arsenic transporter [Peptococcaceae bacterium]
MFDFATQYTLIVFFLMVLFLIWRPRGINESIPPTISAILIFLAGIVPLTDVTKILGIVSGASITILSTIVMSIVLGSIGFFRWAAFNLVNRANGSGILLYWYIILLCFLMTLFFNNDGSILITTPIIIEIVKFLRLRPHQQFPYLLSGALIATASSAPIAVSNLANLIALKIVGLDLNSYVAMMFVPSMLGITVIALLLYYYFRRDIPSRIPTVLVSYVQGKLSVSLSSIPNIPHIPNHLEPTHPVPHIDHLRRPKHVRHPRYENHIGHPRHQHSIENMVDEPVEIDMSMFKVCIVLIVLIRASLFIGASFGIPIELIGIFGALLLILYRWYKKRIGPLDIIRKTPWHIILFAFSIYVVVYALHNIGLTALLVEHLRDPISANYLNASLISGGLLTVMSNLFNNLPSVMIGTFTLTEMGLNTSTLQIAYLASIIGSDIGALLTPIGTLASLIWMFLLRENNIRVRWVDYLKVTIMVIPIGLFISLLSLYVWVDALFF